MISKESFIRIISKNLALLTIFSVIALSSNFSYSHPAAWNHKEAKGIFINSLSYYSTKEFFDIEGKKQPQPKFSKYESQFYYEYGHADDVTLGINSRLQYLGQDSSGNSYGIDNVEIFARQRIYDDGEYVFSVQPLIKIPGIYQKNSRRFFGERQYDVELRLLGAKSFKAFDENHFVNLETAFRKREGSPSDEIRIDATLGMRARSDIMFLGQVFATFATKTQKSSTFLNVNSADYDAVKLQGSIVYELDKEKSLQFGLFQNIEGKNTGAGGGLIFSLWYNF